MNNIPTYKIHGSERREMKKELSSLKSFVKNYWHFHNLDKDMCSIYGSREDFPMKDDVAEKQYQDTINKIKTIEDKLNQLY